MKDGKCLLKITTTKPTCKDGEYLKFMSDYSCQPCPTNCVLCAPDANNNV